MQQQLFRTPKSTQEEHFERLAIIEQNTWTIKKGDDADRLTAQKGTRNNQTLTWDTASIPSAQSKHAQLGRKIEKSYQLPDESITIFLHNTVLIIEFDPTKFLSSATSDDDALIKKVSIQAAKAALGDGFLQYSTALCQSEPDAPITFFVIEDPTQIKHFLHDHDISDVSQFFKEANCTFVKTEKEQLIETIEKTHPSFSPSVTPLNNKSLKIKLCEKFDSQSEKVPELGLRKFNETMKKFKTQTKKLESSIAVNSSGRNIKFELNRTKVEPDKEIKDKHAMALSFNKQFKSKIYNKQKEEIFIKTYNIENHLEDFKKALGNSTKITLIVEESNLNLFLAEILQESSELWKDKLNQPLAENLEEIAQFCNAVANKIQQIWFQPLLPKVSFDTQNKTLSIIFSAYPNLEDINIEEPEKKLHLLESKKFHTLNQRLITIDQEIKTEEINRKVKAAMDYRSKYQSRTLDQYTKDIDIKPIADDVLAKQQFHRSLEQSTMITYVIQGEKPQKTSEAKTWFNLFSSNKSPVQDQEPDSIVKFLNDLDITHNELQAGLNDNKEYKYLCNNVAERIQKNLGFVLLPTVGFRDMGNSLALVIQIGPEKKEATKLRAKEIDQINQEITELKNKEITRRFEFVKPCRQSCPNIEVRNKKGKTVKNPNDLDESTEVTIIVRNDGKEPHRIKHFFQTCLGSDNAEKLFQEAGYSNISLESTNTPRRKLQQKTQCDFFAEAIKNELELMFLPKVTLINEDLFQIDFDEREMPSVVTLGKDYTCEVREIKLDSQGKEVVESLEAKNARIENNRIVEAIQRTDKIDEDAQKFRNTAQTANIQFQKAENEYKELLLLRTAKEKLVQETKLAAQKADQALFTARQMAIVTKNTLTAAAKEQATVANNITLENTQAEEQVKNKENALEEAEKQALDAQDQLRETKANAQKAQEKAQSAKAKYEEANEKFKAAIGESVNLHQIVSSEAILEAAQKALEAKEAAEAKNQTVGKLTINKSQQPQKIVGKNLIPEPEYKTSVLRMSVKNDSENPQKIQGFIKLFGVDAIQLYEENNIPYPPCNHGLGHAIKAELKLSCTPSVSLTQDGLVIESNTEESLKDVLEYLQKNHDGKVFMINDITLFQAYCDKGNGENPGFYENKENQKFSPNADAKGKIKICIYHDPKNPNRVQNFVKSFGDEFDVRILSQESKQPKQRLFGESNATLFPANPTNPTPLGIPQIPKSTYQNPPPGY